MWIQVRSMDGKKVIRVDGLSKLTKIEDLRKKLIDPFDAPVERQRLFYRGKQVRGWGTCEAHARRRMIPLSCHGHDSPSRYNTDSVNNTVTQFTTGQFTTTKSTSTSARPFAR